MPIRNLEKKLSIIAITLGFVAVVGSLIIGLGALNKTSHEMQRQVEQIYLSKAQVLASLVLPDHGFSDSTLLEQIHKTWILEKERPGDEYICIVDELSNLVYHSAAPMTVGNDASGNAIAPTQDLSASTLGELVEVGESYVGAYVSSAGEQQIAAFVPLSHEGWVLGVHRSLTAVEESISRDLRSQYWGMWIISLGIIPLALGILYLTVVRANAHRRRIEVNISQKDYLLKQAQLKYRDLVEGTADLLTRVDMEGKFTFVNQVSKKFFGLSPEECIGLSAFDFVHIDDQEETMTWFREWMASKEPQAAIENRQVNQKTGEIFWMQWTAHLEFDKNGNPVAIGSISRDVTERKQIENKLIESEALKTAILENSPVGVSVRSTNGELLLVNPAWQKIWNVSDEQLKERLKPRKKFSFDKRDSYLGDHLPAVQKVYEEGGAYYVPEVRPLIPAEGKAEWVAQFFYAIQNDEDTFDKVVVLTEDISERKRWEQELIVAKDEAVVNEARYKALHDASFSGVTIHDKGLILDCNQGLVDITGYPFEELIGADGLKLIASHKRDLVWSKIQEGYDKPYETIGIRKNGEEYPLRLEARRIPYEGKQVRVVEFRDITEQKEAEKIRLALESQLRQSQKLEAVGTMVGGISHELNNVLQSMFLYGGMIAENLPADTEVQSNFKHLLDDGERARDIVKQVLTFSRKANIEMKPRFVHELLAEALQLQRASLPPKIRIEQDIDENCGPVLCDKTQIHQMIINLFKNAEHAMDNRAGTISVSLNQVRKSAVDGYPETDMLELIVRDTGHGMTDDTKEKLFDPFFTTKDIGEGTGLGLSVIHGIIEVMRGQISVTSELGSGTSFNILLPVVNESVEEAGERPVVEGMTEALSILLVDDEDSIRNATRAILKRKGIAVETASDGSQALELFRKNPSKYTLVVTDLSMPVLSGIELARAIHELDADIPIILSTGQLGIKNEVNFDELGITGLIQKPWTTNELLECIKGLEKTS